MTVAGELCVIGQLVLRGTCVIIPSKLQPRTLALAHESHLGMIGTKQNLRTKVCGQGWVKRLRDIAEHAIGVSWWHSQIPLNLFHLPHYPMDHGKT